MLPAFNPPLILFRIRIRRFTLTRIHIRLSEMMRIRIRTGNRGSRAGDHSYGNAANMLTVHLPLGCSDKHNGHCIGCRGAACFSPCAVFRSFECFFNDIYDDYFYTMMQVLLAMTISLGIKVALQREVEIFLMF
jgi:hypothetical protein